MRRLTRSLFAAFAAVAFALPAARRSRRKSACAWATTSRSAACTTRATRCSRSSSKSAARARSASMSSRPRSLASEVAMVEGVRLGSIDMICANAPNAATVDSRARPVQRRLPVPGPAALRARRQRSEVRQAHRRPHREQEPRHQADRLLLGGCAQHLQPQGLGRQPRRSEGREDPRAEQPGRGEGLEHVRRDPDADELRRGVPGAAVRRARRGRKRARRRRLEQALRGREVHLADRASAQPFGAATSTRRSSRACRPTCRRSCSTRRPKPRCTSARRTPSSSPPRPTG